MFKAIDSIVLNRFFHESYIITNELRKIALLRIITGLIIFIRFFEILVSQVYLYGYSNATIFLILFLVIVVLFTVGLFTPVATFLILVSIPFLDAKLVTNTLGSTIAINLLIVMLLANAGQYYSMDRFIVSKNGAFSRIITKLHAMMTAIDDVKLKRAYFIGFILYALSSLFALWLHIEDPHWMDGVTIRAMLTNTFLCKHAMWFRSLEAAVPGLLDVMSIVGIIFQSCFQILMIPLLLFKPGKFFVKVWGFIFFFVSLFFLSLSYLPHLELVLWLIIFCPVTIPVNKIQILYDDRCNLCKKAMRFFKWINVNGIYEFLPVSQNRELYSNHDLTEVEVKTYMVGFYGNTIAKGYDLYRLMFAKNPALCIFYPVLWLAKITRIGPYIYGRIAARRYKLMDSCEISLDNSLQKEERLFTISTNNHLVRYVYAVYFTGIVLFICANNSFFRYVFKNNAKVMGYAASYKKFCKRLGMEVPVVFNNADLSMGDNFMVIKKWVNNEWRLLPIVDDKGQRLNYLGFDILLFTNHNSDMLYFGQTLRYRRALIKGISDPVTYHEKGFGKEHMDFLVKYDYSSTKEKGTVKYKVEVFQSNASKVKLFVQDPGRYTLAKVYEKYIEYN